jgi:osmotically-inducible protein OsmY
MNNRHHSLTSEQKPDRGLHDAVIRRLDREGPGRLKRVRCKVQKGTAVLWGYASNAAERDQAVRLVAGCPGIHAVVNRIQLNPIACTIELAAA